MPEYSIDAPFALGQTYNGTTGDTSDAQNYEGREYVFSDTRWGNGAGIRARVVRNISTTTLVGGRLANLATTALTGAYYGCRIDGYASTTAQRCYPIDDLLGSTGVAPNDLCYIIVGGLAIVKTDLAPGAGLVINPGDQVVAVTASTSGATTSGRAKLADYTGATLLLANQIMNFFTAVSAATTANTNSDLLVQVRW